MKGFSVDLLAAHGFDLSERMGTILSTSQDMSDIGTVRDVFNELFPDASDLQRTLAIDDLYLLNKRRSLLVHRRGIIDQTYLDETSDKALIGTELRITPDYLAHCLILVRDSGNKLLEAMSAQFARNQSI